MNDTIKISREQLEAILDNSYGVIADDIMYDLVCDYEDADDIYHPYAFIELDGSGIAAYVISEDMLKGEIKFNKRLASFYIDGMEDEIPPFKVLQIVTEIK
jgi:hypothetical protein